ncbi:MAG: hypothetical protein AAF684_11875, partial [Pseudomonadota bacterium]
VCALTGRGGGWAAQNRADRGEAPAVLLRLSAPIAAAGGALALGFFAIGPMVAVWTAPLWLGLATTPALAWAAAHPAVGRAARGLGLAATPEERRPSRALRRAGMAAPIPVARRVKPQATALDGPLAAAASGR